MSQKRDRDSKDRPIPYVVIVQRTAFSFDCYGPYSYFEEAERDAQAWMAYQNVQQTFVLPMFQPDLFVEEATRNGTPKRHL